MEFLCEPIANSTAMRCTELVTPAEPIPVSWFTLGLPRLIKKVL